MQSAQNDLTAAALDALRLRSESVAGSLHLAVLRYRDLRVGNAEAEGGLMPRMAGAMAATAAPVADPGEAVIRVTVEAELLLAPSLQ